MSSHGTSWLAQVLAAYALFASAGCIAPESPSEETASLAQGVVTTAVSIPLSDGVEVRGDVHLPEEGGRYPVVLVMTPYGRVRYSTAYVSKGYAHVNIDIRGTGRSEGTLCIFCEREQQDVYEVVEWIAKQPWCDGNVGMMGASYNGITALLGASKQPPHLKAIAPSVVYTDPYRDIAWHNGMYTVGFTWQWSLAQAGLGLTEVPPIDPSDPPDERAYNWNVLLESRTRPHDEPTYWERSVYRDLEGDRFGKIVVPTLLIGGWFDGFSRGTVKNFQGIKAAHKRLIMTPWTHKLDGNNFAFDPASPYKAVTYPDDPDPVLAWFDHFLKGVDNGVETRAPVRYYDLGHPGDLLGNRDNGGWRSADTWPPPGSSVRTFYLSGELDASIDSLNSGSLTTAPPEAGACAKECEVQCVAGLGEGTGLESTSLPICRQVCAKTCDSDSYLYDPTAASGKTESLSKYGTIAVTPMLRADQRDEERKALTYTTPPMAEDLKLCGPMELRFFAETEATSPDPLKIHDTDWVVKVSDVEPDLLDPTKAGASLLISAGYMRASHRAWDENKSVDGEPWIINTKEAAQPPSKKKPDEYRVDIWGVCNTIKKGHRLRVAVYSADAPSHEPSPHHARNTVYRSGGYPSRLLLTLAP